MTNDAIKPCPFCDILAIETVDGFAVHHRANCFMRIFGSTYFSHGQVPLWNTRAALAQVDVDAGLRALDYQRDLALIFLVAKGSKDYDETIGDRIERVQELILQLKKQNDHLAAQGYIGEWRPIECAPKDGTWIMVYWPTMGIGQYPFVVFWDEGWQPARYSDRDYGEAFPTHWMPLPAAPKKEGM